MDQEQLKLTAKQLRKPEGEMGLKIGRDMNEVNEDMNRCTIEALDPSPGDHILEIGMGNGLFVKDIVSRDSVKYIGCDFSPLMVEEASKNNMEYMEKGQVDFLVASANELPFEDSKFHKVFTINTLYFWDDHSRILSELRRVLKPGGELLIVIRPKEVMQQLPFTSFGFQLYSGEDVTGLLKDHGFHSIEVIEKEEKPSKDQEVKLEGAKVVLRTLICRGKKIVQSS